MLPKGNGAAKELYVLGASDAFSFLPLLISRRLCKRFTVRTFYKVCYVAAGILGQSVCSRRLGIHLHVPAEGYQIF